MMSRTTRMPRHDTLIHFSMKPMYRLVNSRCSIGISYRRLCPLSTQTCRVRFRPIADARRPRQTNYVVNEMPDSEGEGSAMPFGIGCASSMLVLNILLPGMLAWSFTQGPYSSREQELWYRYGSIAFLMSGAILPGVALAAGAWRSRPAVRVLTAWMLGTLTAAFCYAALSGGGV